ncbi:MAG TPA: zinc-ribbon domain-containing protein [Solirubrobacteraceae bacterium]|nr:zinc-ribbon domain-containing protein [Solirubrobacteraceae bacterium]
MSQQPESKPDQVDLGPECPTCHEPWLRPTNMPGRYRCVYCLSRYELTSVCPDCGEHSTIVRMASTAVLTCNNCGGSMLRRL